MILKRRALLVGLLCAALASPAQPVGAEDPDASDPPRVSGPLVGSPLGCQDDGPPRSGEVSGQTCSWTYQYVGESNRDEDFWVYWIQMEIHPGKGMCAHSMSFEIRGLEGGRIVSAVPRRGGRAGKPRLTTTELVVDARGDAVLPGTIAQDGLLGTGRTTVSKGKDHYVYNWWGNSPHKVVVSLGIEVASAAIPTGFFNSWSEGMGGSMGSCRTPGIGVGGG